MASISPTSRPGYVYDSATDTWIPIGIGPHTHQATDLSGVVDDALIDAKGDLIVGSAADTPARLAVGNNGETLVADSSASTGLRWQGNFAAGKNKVINGGFDIWQRGSSVNLSSNTPTFLADRFSSLVVFSAGTASISRQTFTPGTAPASGYEAQYFHRLNTGTTATYYEINTKIEDVRTLAGQTITFSFWAKASSAGTVKNLIRQNFGSGGSANVDNTVSFNLTTSWTRFTRTETLGSMTGKTIGANSFLQIFLYQDTGALGGLDIDIWGVQIEASNTATAFQTATGTLAGELAACQRYYYRLTANNYQALSEHGMAGSTTNAWVTVKFPVSMRTTPSSIEYSTTYSLYALQIWASTSAITAITQDNATTERSVVLLTASGLTQYRPMLFIAAPGQNGAYLGWSAEL